MKGLMKKAGWISAMTLAMAISIAARAQTSIPQVDGDIGQVEALKEDVAANGNFAIPVAQRVIDCNTTASACRKIAQPANNDPQTYTIDEQAILDAARKHEVGPFTPHLSGNDASKDEPTAPREVVPG